MKFVDANTGRTIDITRPHKIFAMTDESYYASNTNDTKLRTKLWIGNTSFIVRGGIDDIKTILNFAIKFHNDHGVYPENDLLSSQQEAGGDPSNCGQE